MQEENIQIVAYKIQKDNNKKKIVQNSHQNQNVLGKKNQEHP